jgi:hypothetical protein
VRLQRRLRDRGAVPVVLEELLGLLVAAATLPCFIDSTMSFSSAWV